MDTEAMVEDAIRIAAGQLPRGDATIEAWAECVVALSGIAS